MKRPKAQLLDPELVKGLCQDRVMVRPWNVREWELVIESRQRYIVNDDGTRENIS